MSLFRGDGYDSDEVERIIQRGICIGVILIVAILFYKVWVLFP